MRRIILTEEDLNKIFSLEFTEEELVEYFTLTTEELVRVNRINKDYNKVGFLLVKKTLLHKGYILNNFEHDIPNNLIEFVCKQLGVDGYVNLSLYSRTTRHEDTRSIMKELGYKKFKLTDGVRYRAFQIAIANDSNREMMIDFIYYLSREKVILPSISTLEKVIYDADRESEKYIYTNILKRIGNKSEIESILDVRDRISDYNKVKEGHRGIEDIKNKIYILEKYSLDIDLGFIPYRKLQGIYMVASNLSREQLLRLSNKEKRAAYILIFVEQELKKLRDELIIIDRLEEKNRLNKKVVTKYNLVYTYNQFLEDLGFKRYGVLEGVLINTFLNLVIGKKINRSIKIQKGPGENEEEIIYIDKKKLNNFKDKYIVEKYTVTEKRDLIANSDKLKDLTLRRTEGEYYTDEDWVDEAHKKLEEELGVNWKSKYITYDCASGKGNLTNGYDFKELYSSTLNKEDLEFVEQGVKFQLDFLKDSIESSKTPSKLIDALECNKPIVFLINPPYVANKENIEVYKEGIGFANIQTYTLFLLKILEIKRKYNLTNVYIAIFAPLTYITSSKYSKFREEFLSEFNFTGGFTFSANEFNSIYRKDLTTFAIWGTGECKNKNEFLFQRKERDEEGEIVTKSISVLSNKG